MTVATNGSFTLLILSDNALLTNSLNGVIGRNATAKSNEVQLISASARWRMGDSLFVGSNGAFSRLVVSNGALVANNHGLIGTQRGSSNNFALVTGSGSLWSNRQVVSVGNAGRDNQLTVSNGGWVASLYGYVGADPSASNNLALVTGAGSVWSNAVDVIVGFSGPRNRLVIDAGGLVRGDNGYVGNFSASNNEALVTGPGSLWTNRSDLFVGVSGNGNRLVVSNGGTVFIARNGVIGVNSSASSNSVFVTDPGTRWMAASNLYVGSNGAFNLLVVSNGASVTDDIGLLSGGPSGASNRVLVTGTGSIWNNRVGLVIGNQGGSNRLVVSNGAMVVDGFCSIGVNASSNNSVQVTGVGSVWSNALELRIGNFGAANRVVVEDGARLLTEDALLGAFSANNEAVITGTGSVWSNRNELFVGYAGSGNRLIVSNAGSVCSTISMSVGGFANSTNNRVVVDGGLLRVTNDTAAGILDVRRGTNVLNSGLIETDLLLLTNTLGKFEFNGGTLITRGAFINNNAAFNVGNSGGTPAVWDVRAGASDHFVAGTLHVGADSSFNQLILTNGALLTNYGFASLGSFPVARSNSATLAGAGSRWRLGDGVLIGDFGSGNRLVVSNGASLITDSFSYIGFEFVSTNNEAVVTGPGSSWTSGPGEMFVGYRGRDNRLLVSDGGQVVSFAGTIGDFANSTNNLAVVTGAGSSWSAATELRVGGAGAANRLVVSNGGTVFAGSAVYTGFDPTSTRNRLTVDGGTLRTTNASATGILDVRGGTNVLNAGLIDVDHLVLTNTLGLFEFNGGTLQTRSTTVSNGSSFIVGSGTSAATLQLQGGTHVFANQLVIAGNASLVGNGTIIGNVTNASGGVLSPGASIGQFAVAGSVSLAAGSTNFFEINKAVTTNDNIVASGSIIYGGTLIVTHLDGALTNGDSFKLFTAASYSGSFANLLLPALPAGLSWKNNLRLDGSLQVVITPNRDFGVDVSLFQDAGGVSQDAWNQMFAEGKRFVFIKATEGLTGPHDLTMPINVARASAAGLLVGVYHFAHPENRPTTDGAILEASNMVVYAGSAIGPGRLRPVLDIEGNATTLSTTALTDWVIAFSDEIIARRGLGAAPIIYCTQNSANNEFESRLANYDLWLRTVNSGVDPAVDDPPAQGSFTNAFGVFNNWSFWQYSATGSSGGISPLDLDVCHSEYKLLSSYLIPSPPSATIQQSNNLLTVSWPSNAFRLETTFDLAPPVFWQEITNSISDSGGVRTFTLTNDLAVTNQFFRLVFP